MARDSDGDNKGKIIRKHPILKTKNRHPGADWMTSGWNFDTWTRVVSEVPSDTLHVFLVQFRMVIRNSKIILVVILDSQNIVVQIKGTKQLTPYCLFIIY